MSALVTAMATRLDTAVSIDNGIMHMISLANIPMIILFGQQIQKNLHQKYFKRLDSKKIHNTSDINLITAKYDQI